MRVGLVVGRGKEAWDLAWKRGRHFSGPEFDAASIGCRRALPVSGPFSQAAPGLAHPIVRHAAPQTACMQLLSLSRVKDACLLLRRTQYCVEATRDKAWNEVVVSLLIDSTKAG